MKKTTRGFTIVELLIVIVVIAILAAISIVAYNGIQERARISRVQSDLANIAKTMSIYNVDNPTYPTSTTEIQATGIKKALSSSAANVAMFCGETTGYAVIINEKDDYTGRQFKIGTGIPLTEIAPKVAWSGAALCGTTSYTARSWNSGW